MIKLRNIINADKTTKMGGIAIMFGKISLLIAVALILTISIANAENLISGYILDKTTGEPIGDASIVVKGTNIGTVSDRNGYFEIDNTTTKMVTLIISRIGYQNAMEILNSDNNSLSNITIKLISEAIPVKNINVTASRFAEDSFESPMSITVTSSEKFAARSNNTTSEVLREEPGILVQKTTYGHGAPIIRGLIGSHVLLLYNGIRLNRPTFRMGGNQYLNTIDLSSLNRIEVVRGPSSVMYGSDALAGVINMIPQLHPFTNQILSLQSILSTEYSTADNGFISNINFIGSKNPLAAFFNISYKNINDLRAGGKVGTQKPTGWNEYDLTGKIYYIINENNSLNFDYLAVRQNDVPRYDNYVSGDNIQYIYDPQNRDLMAITYGYYKEDSRISEIKANISYSFEKEGRIEQKTGSSTIKNSLDKLSTFGSYIQMSMNINKKQKLAVGSEYYYDMVRSHTISTTGDISEETRSAYPDKSKYYQTGLFVQHDWQLYDHIKFISGIRYSNIRLKSPLEEPYGMVDEIYDDLTGSLALTYLVAPSVNLTTRWSRGFRAPSLNDVAVLKSSSSGIDVPSLGLNPEYSDNFEIGTKIITSIYTGNMFVFYTLLSNLIDRTPGIYKGMAFDDLNNNGIQDDGEASYYQRKNVASAYIYGFEYDGHLILSNTWELKANLFYTYGQNKTDHEPLSRIPPLMGLFGLQYNLTPANWYEIYLRAAAKQDRLSTRDLDDSRINNDGNPGWTTVNFRTQYKIQRFQINLALENIFDQSYKEHSSGIYSPGRNLRISLSYGK